MSKGNGAREALTRWFDEAADFGSAIGVGPDQLLAWLWVEGFKIVPLAETDVAGVTYGATE